MQYIYDVEYIKNKYYVYALFDENGTPFYIGKGINGRVNSHVRPHSIKRRSRKSTKIRKLLDIYGYVRRDVLCYFDKEVDALSFENYLINLYGVINKGGILTNVVDVIFPPIENFVKRKPSLHLASDDEIINAHNKWYSGRWDIKTCSNYLGINEKTVTEIFRGAKRKYLILPKGNNIRIPRTGMDDQKYELIFKLLVDRFVYNKSYNFLVEKYNMPKTTISRYCKLGNELSKSIYDSEQFKVLLNGTGDSVSQQDTSIANLANAP